MAAQMASRLSAEQRDEVARARAVCSRSYRNLAAQLPLGWKIKIPATVIIDDAANQTDNEYCYLHIDIPSGKNFWAENVKKNKKRSGKQIHERPFAFGLLRLRSSKR